jgi:molybdopterin-guanine dinucleotide biosynthesis protein A
MASLETDLPWPHGIGEALSQWVAARRERFGRIDGPGLDERGLYLRPGAQFKRQAVGAIRQVCRPIALAIPDSFFYVASMERFSGVILAGGNGTRLSGTNKALLQVGGQSILGRLLDIFNALFDETILVTRNPQAFLDWDCHIVTDLFAASSSLTGIHAGLFHARHPQAFISACDTPFVSRPLIEHLLSRSAAGHDVVIPRSTGGLEPLCAVYARTFLSGVERHLRQGRFKIQELLTPARTLEVDISRLPAEIPSENAFFNVNTPADLQRARQMAAMKGN